MNKAGTKPEQSRNKAGTKPEQSRNKAGTKPEQSLLLHIGARIKDLRNKKGISQEKFALECGFDRTYISRIELGKRNLSVGNLYRVARALGVRLTELLDKV